MIGFWLQEYEERIAVRDEASISEARRCVRELGERHEFSRELVEGFAIVASELARNQLRYAGTGRLVCTSVERDGSPGLRLLAADNGPGIEQPSRFLSGDEAPTDSLRQGLASVLRLADEVNFDIRLQEGSCISATAYERQCTSFGFESALLGRPHPDETVSGDAGLFLQQDKGFFAAIADGVGHGREARKAADLALAYLREHSDQPLDRLLTECDRHLRASRGASLMLARYDGESQSLEAAAAGDIAGELHCPRAPMRRLSSAAHSLGLAAAAAQAWRPLVERFEISAGTLLILCSDGLKSQLGLNGREPFFRRHPILLADHLLENFSRGTDDATVLVVRFANRH